MILNIVNSFIGKKGNIGVRTSFILNELNIQKIRNYSFSRGVIKGFEKNNKNMGVFGHVSRILNAYRIYINLWFNHRKYDIWIFEKFFFLFYKKSTCKNRIAHIWEISPKIISKLKDDGCKVILDVPIAPTATAKELIKNYGDSIVLHPHDYNDNLERESFTLSDKIIVPSIFVKDELEKIGVEPHKIIIIPFGVDSNEIQPKVFDKDYIEDGLDFIFAGNVSKRKGVEFLLEAWTDERFKNDRLHLCGRLYPEIENLLNEYNFKNVITPGFVDTQEYFRNCDVYVFPSLLEGSSKSIYEAMNASLPCIVTPNSGSIIENGKSGFIINVANPNEIKDRMLFFKENPNNIEIMGKKAKENVSQYTWENYAKNVINVYCEINK